MPSASTVLAKIRGFHADLTEIRRDIHANPELGMEEHRTAELVAKQLESWGIEVHRGVGGTGGTGAGGGAAGGGTGTPGANGVNGQNGANGQEIGLP